MIHVIATIELNAGTRDEFLKHFHAIVPAVHQEQGCLEYGPTVDVATGIAAQDGPRDNGVVVVEKWESVDALKAHLAAPHMQEYREKVKGLVARTTLHVLQPA